MIDPRTTLAPGFPETMLNQPHPNDEIRIRRVRGEKKLASWPMVWPMVWAVFRLPRIASFTEEQKGADERGVMAPTAQIVRVCRADDAVPGGVPDHRSISRLARTVRGVPR